jgi:hypothetical protein
MKDGRLALIGFMGAQYPCGGRAEMIARSTISLRDVPSMSLSRQSRSLTSGLIKFEHTRSAFIGSMK